MEPQVQPNSAPVNNGLPAGVHQVGTPPPPPTAGAVPAVEVPGGTPPPPPQTPAAAAAPMANGGVVSSTKSFFKETNWVLVFVGIVGVAGVCGIIWYVRKRAYVFDDKQQETDLRIMSLQSQITEINKEKEAPGTA